jgi:hypothetical protein
MEAPCLDTACTALIKGCTPGAVVSYDTCNPCAVPASCGATRRLLTDLGVAPTSGPTGGAGGRQLGTASYQCSCDGTAVLEVSGTPCKDDACTVIVGGSCEPDAVISNDICNPGPPCVVPDPCTLNRRLLRAGQAHGSPHNTSRALQQRIPYTCACDGTSVVTDDGVGPCVDPDCTRALTAEGGNCTPGADMIDYCFP